MLRSPLRLAFCIDDTSAKISATRDRIIVTCLALNDRTLLQNLRNHIVVLACAELVLELALGCSVQNTLRTMPVNPSRQYMLGLTIRPPKAAPLYTLPRRRRHGSPVDGKRRLLMCHEDLPAAHHLRHWCRLVILPVPHRLRRVNEDDVVVGAALVVDFVLGLVSAHADGCWSVCGECVGVEDRGAFEKLVCGVKV